MRFLNSGKQQTTGFDLQLYKDNKMNQEGGMHSGKQQMPRLERNLLVYITLRTTKSNPELTISRFEKTFQISLIQKKLKHFAMYLKRKIRLGRDHNRERLTISVG